MISPSLIEMYLDCPRKAAGRYWGESYGWPRPPQGAGAGLGDELHTIADDYLNYGKPPDRYTVAGNLFIAGLPYLPDPCSGGVEGEFVMRVAGVEYTGKIDYRGPLPARAMFDGKREDVDRVVLDHKTSASPIRYGVWGEAINPHKSSIDGKTHLRNPQSIIYAARDMVEARDDKSRLRWLYYPSKTKGDPQPIPSDAVLTKGEIEGAFGELIHPVAVRLVQLKKDKPDPLTLEPNTSHCSAYATREQRDRGAMGCAFHVSNGGPCNPTPHETFAGVARALEKPKPSNGGTMSDVNILALLESANAGKPAPAPAPAAPVHSGATGTPRDPINPPESHTVAASIAPAASAVRPASTPAAAAQSKTSTPATPPPSPGATDHIAHVVKVVCDELGKAFAKIAGRL